MPEDLPDPVLRNLSEISEVNKVRTQLAVFIKSWKYVALRGSFFSISCISVTVIVYNWNNIKCWFCAFNQISISIQMKLSRQEQIINIGDEKCHLLVLKTEIDSNQG